MLKKHNKLRIDYPQILIGMTWINTIVLQYIRASLMRIPVIGHYPDAIIAAIYLCLTVAVLFHIKGSIHKIDLVYFFAIVLVFLLNEILCPDNQQLMAMNAGNFFTTVFPMFYIGRLLGDSKRKTLDLLCKLSALTIVLCICYQSIFVGPMTDVQSLYQGNMDLAYKLLPHCCLVSYKAIREHKIVTMLIAAISILYLTMLGTRGAVLLMFLFLGFTIVLFSQTKHKVLIALVLVTTIAVFLYSPLFIFVIKLLGNVSAQYGLSVRIFSKILSGQVNYDSGRSLLQNQVVEAIGKKPLTGYGLYADRTLLGTYVHSLPLELMMQFGILFGIALFAGMALLPLRAFFEETREDYRALVLVLYCSALLKLLMSSSYLNENLLFMMLGLCVSIHQNRKSNLHLGMQ